MVDSYLVNKSPDRGPESGKTPAQGQAGTGGIHLRTVNLIFIVAAFLVAAALFVCNARVNRGYRETEEASSRYLRARQAANDLEAGSDYLTDRVQSFVVTGDMSYLHDFFVEAQITKRRDHALEQMEELLGGNTQNSAYEKLAAALDYSNELMQLEYRAMRLELAVKGDDPAELGMVPREVAKIELSEEERALSESDLHARALDLVFDDTYMGYKEKIWDNVGACTRELIESSSQALDQATARMNLLLRLQTFLTGIFLLMVLFLVWFISARVRTPLTRLVRHMKDQKTMEPAGAAELRFVTSTYNEILIRNREQQEQLTYDAMHDALTGLYNRSAYEMFMKDTDLKHAGLMIVDVDRFKEVNDTYGHDVGDKVLRRVAETLRSSFRSVDIVCRIGGDEFVVIVTRTNSSMSDSIVEKVKRANRMLEVPGGDIPAVTLSVGIAFGDRTDPGGSLFKDADRALYQVKEAGRSGCIVYGM